MGKSKLTLSQPKNPEPIVTKFEWRNYVVDPYHQKNWAQSDCPKILWKWGASSECVRAYWNTKKINTFNNN